MCRGEEKFPVLSECCLSLQPHLHMFFRFDFELIPTIKHYALEGIKVGSSKLYSAS